MLDIIAAFDVMKKRQNRAWFRNLWQGHADEYEFYDLAAHLDPTLTFREFDHYWQYAYVLDPCYTYARQEFTRILFGGL